MGSDFLYAYCTEPKDTEGKYIPGSPSLVKAVTERLRSALDGVDDLDDLDTMGAELEFDETVDDTDLPRLRQKVLAFHAETVEEIFGSQFGSREVNSFNPDYLTEGARSFLLTGGMSGVTARPTPT